MTIKIALFGTYYSYRLANRAILVYNTQMLLEIIVKFKIFLEDLYENCNFCFSSKEINYR